MNSSTFAHGEVWRTVKLGTGLKTADEFRKALKKIGGIGDGAVDILGSPAFKVSSVETEVDLVVCSGKELGFRGGGTREQTYNRAKEIGFDLCPAEVGPQLREQYRDQPKGEWLFVAMEPILDSQGYPRLFYVGRDTRGKWLYGIKSSPGFCWNNNVRWAFLRRRKVSSQN